jgi:hypothetical protein
VGQLVIACYRPKPGKSDQLVAELEQHVAMLQQLGFVTSRAPIHARAKDGTVVEIFEWVSADAVGQAHTHPAVAEIWGRFAELSDYVTLRDLTESDEKFAHFTALA